MGSGWLGRRRSPRLSGTLHLRDATGREVAVPLRGRATVLTAGGTGLIGYAEVWAVHTEAGRAATSLMISYGPDGAEGDRASGLCAPGGTVALGGVSFTWRHQPAVALRPPIAPDPIDISAMPAMPGAPIPRQRENMPRVAGASQAANIRPEPSGANPLHNMLRLVKQVSRGKRSASPAPSSPPAPPP
ncbi:hypothetical protein AMIS_55710 [Actinoplanes missouriensis 431]|uniref:Uncharacterized protein n=1 Tax=Actinoplanes missouriensis (strain ATCC 14538 / DSM 43046 / CBS 188.64 / JCM 3121 / NBRC 102363 / NCIMB 12654 / NRRL B-3342 / UNCC 431) TaxID=512565 RepID=I0HCQ4_ACTM4|nr:hypothetical protein [Actinoplanes missouriensis]BAL90791.1 hypothetical protein AMIS_55710 [Actinoplanes missouriensis 431]